MPSLLQEVVRRPRGTSDLTSGSAGLFYLIAPGAECLPVADCAVTGECEKCLTHVHLKENPLAEGQSGPTARC